MTGKWLEINSASKYLDVELEFLCEQVIKGHVNSTTSDDQLMIDVSSFEDTAQECAQKNIDEVEAYLAEIEDLHTKIAWLESENMGYEKRVEEYQKNFLELKGLQTQLMTVINQQSETIRKLRGYKPVDKAAKEIKKSKRQRAFQPIASLWMLLPVIGLLLTAAYEIVKTYELYSIASIKTVLGL